MSCVGINRADTEFYAHLLSYQNSGPGIQFAEPTRALFTKLIALDGGNPVSVCSLSSSLLDTHERGPLSWYRAGK